MSDGGVHLDKTLFWKRLSKLVSGWKKGGAFWGANNPFSVLMVAIGKRNEDVIYSRTIALQLSLFGYELSDTILVLCNTTLYICTSPKKVQILTTLGSASENGRLKLVLLQKKKGKDKTFTESYNALIDAIKKISPSPRIGYVKKDVPLGNFTTGFLKALSNQSIEVGDCSAGFSSILAVKDTAAQNQIRKSAELSSLVLRKWLVPEIETVIDEEKKIKHSTMAEKCEDIISDPSKVGSSIKPDNVESCYTPIIMSGGNYDLKPSASSDDNNLHYGTVICELGVRYKNWCTNLARTYFINPTDDQKEVYQLLIKVYVACKDKLRKGNSIQSIYEVAVQTIKKNNEKYLPHFTKNCGFSMGLEFRESTFVIKGKKPSILKAGMIFNLCVGFNNIKTTDAEKLKDPKTATFAVLLADTLLVREEGDAECLTRNCPRKYEDVAYFIGDDNEDEQPQKQIETSVPKRRGSRSVTKDKLREQKSKLQENSDLIAKQKELARRKQEEAMRRLSEDTIGKGFDATKVKQERFVSYKSVGDMPQISTNKRIQIDVVNKTINFPICGNMVPMHIATVKNVHKSLEGRLTVLRVTFLTPDDTGANKPPHFAKYDSNFIKELSYRGHEENLGKIFFDIKELRKRWMASLKAQQNQKTLVVQEALKMSSSEGLAKLRGVNIRPVVARKSTPGVVVAHTNGFRFSVTTNTEKIRADVIYKNIKHAFFQPAKNSLTVVLHFELHNEIVLGKKKPKKTKYIQFYVEVMEASQDLDTRGRYDEDGLLEEQEERRRRTRENERFRAFVQTVEAKVPKMPGMRDFKLEFDIPYREFAFTGVASRTTVTLMPTVHSLVALEDLPPLVVTLSEIEVCNFERVQFQLRNFDLAIVFKDYTKPVLRIDAIPTKSLEPIKQWLNSCEILFFESPQNILWKNVMKEVIKDPRSFFSAGGWNFLSGGDEDEEGSDVVSSASEFEPDESGTDDEEYDSGSEVSEESESEWDSGSESGEDWETMEKKARQSDKVAGAKEERYQKEKAAREKAERGQRKRGGSGRKPQRGRQQPQRGGRRPQRGRKRR